MGRTLLAELDDVALNELLARHPLVAHTAHTITDPARWKAELARVRQQGWCLVDQELEEGLRVVAAPVRDARGRIVASVSVSTLASGSTREMILHEMLPAVQRAATAIEVDLAPVAR
jgi:IclR family pca regulon transcriptional regulator